MDKQESLLEPIESAEALGAERRREARYPCGLRFFWSEPGPQPTAARSGTISDISATGVGLLVNGPVKPGTILILKLQGNDQRVSRPLPARVMHVTARDDGAWLVGCAFLRRLNNEDLQAVLDRS